MKTKLQTFLLAYIAAILTVLALFQADQWLQGRLFGSLIPIREKPTESGQLNAIAGNLRILEGAKEQYALEHRLTTTALVTEADLLPYLKGGLAIQPVVGETYIFRTVGDLVEANWAGTLAGKTGPFTVTSF